MVQVEKAGFGGWGRVFPKPLSSVVVAVICVQPSGRVIKPDARPSLRGGQQASKKQAKRASRRAAEEAIEDVNVHRKEATPAINTYWAARISRASACE